MAAIHIAHQPSLTHWCRVTHICVGNLTIIGSDKGLSPNRRQAIIWSSDGILWIRPSGTNFSDILIKYLTFWFMKMRLNVSSAKWRPFCLGLNVLKQRAQPPLDQEDRLRLAWDLWPLGLCNHRCGDKCQQVKNSFVTGKKNKWKSYRYHIFTRFLFQFFKMVKFGNVWAKLIFNMSCHIFPALRYAQCISEDKPKSRLHKYTF